MSLHVECEGAGEPVLFLHGVSGSGATYRWLTLEGRRAVRLTFRGHGASARRPGTYRVPDYAQDAISVLDEIGPAAIVGHSLGGVTAWTVAQRRPELVTKLFLEDPPLFGGEPEIHAASTSIRHFVDQQAAVRVWQARGATEAEIEAELVLDGTQTPDAIAAHAYALRHLDPEVLDRVIDGTCVAGTDTTSAVSVPVLIVGADEGSAFPEAHAARLAQTHPAATVVRIPGAPHTIHDTAAARGEYVERLLAFL
ncbi:alpha/beta hydrolase [Solirubrobacter taibaiensis]|nr:alpha/beta hydrolase [Solirubrobacter taibaiensis]